MKKSSCPLSPREIAKHSEGEVMVNSAFIQLFVFALLLSACGKQAAAPTAALAPERPTALATEASIPTEPSAPTDTPVPAPAQDPTLFGSILQSEAQGGFVLEPVANAIFVKTMGALKTSGMIQEYLVTRVTIFPGNGGLLSEIIFNVQTADPAWLADGGTPAADNWINEKCYRFDFVTIETEYQLRNQRLCN